jgi:nucleoid DNA-binding protein
MKGYIKEILIKNKKLLIKGLGTFEVVYKSSEIHPILHTFSTPGQYVVFSFNEQESSNELAEYIALKDKVELSEAEKFVGKWLDDLKNTIKIEKEYDLGTLGVFSIDAVGKIQFIPALDYDISPESFGMENFTAAPVSTKSEGQTIEQKNRKKKRKKRGKVRSVFQIIGFSFLILLLLLIITVGVYSIIYPNDFYLKKDILIMRINQWIKTYENDKTEPPVYIVDTVSYMQDESIYNDEITTTISDSFTEVEEITTEMEIPKEKEIKIEKSTKEETPPLIKEKSTAKGNVFIVLGSFKDEKNANDFMRTLQSKHDNVVDLGKGEKSGIWMIGLGPYELPEAQKVLKENKLNGWILKK